MAVKNKKHHNTKNKKTTVLIIMDGWGVAPLKNKGNPIQPNITPNYFRWLKDYPHTELQASGTSVGLFKGQEGNSEAGHINLGAGRVVKQDAMYISDAINDGTFFKNNAFHQAFYHVKKYNSSIHVMGLLSNHNSAHSCPEHLYALMDLLRREKFKKVYLHLFTDGRDSSQHDAPHHLKKLYEHLNNGEKIATIMGRFYAMDRSKTWKRIKQSYDALVLANSKHKAPSATEAVLQAYNRGETDEFIQPTVIIEKGEPVGKISSNDAIFFFNLRSDRARELTKVFVQRSFDKENDNSFVREKLPRNIRFVAMTDFGPDLPGVLTAFPSRDVTNSLVQILCPRRQLFVAETEKFAHVTYFFNGGYSHHFCEDRWVKINSVAVDNYSKKPKMNAGMVSDYVSHAIESCEYDFICVNFANPDIVAHTGDIKATEIAVKTVDSEVERLIKIIKKNGGQGIVTADHGNAEELVDLKTGEINTEHSTNMVPLFLIGEHFYKKRLKMKKGKLADVAPTILKMMGVKQPKEMTGRSLIK
ncbi:MAG: 2,3-bisphosphoglycerate-independent phosphoglycerate mutase [Candidatus Magasanikbacteria bacterium CG10_big_fil_rev_8_21_14_0_10_36_32]|uniref:2,3-bisphosphoglycerate-independent phosphoglycerate mutase n=1 Tax=Candidatus Magasanikbacteria bacterium CG10_big_fil_rev_8_21_14_0_10_36_32 TaxID=1974646 RepID=A0A2M6W6C6_9BACT|nr:MAG: 2,3-bisphosphoglycerate-independent phosphoglycerate mutase [Candidatus Magasanikbacteria bacterium CG10_big_fil_rev_8_21_14_0_10_36_32]